MWKTRETSDPPPNFWADFVANVNVLFPGATLDKKTLDELHRLVVDEWRNGTQVHLIVRQLCSCDGATVVPSKGARMRLGRKRGIARAPEGAVAGQVFGVDELRDPAPLARLIAQQAMIEARIRSESGKKSTAKRQQTIDALRTQRTDVMGAIVQMRDSAYWSRKTDRGRDDQESPRDEPLPEPKIAAPPKKPRARKKKAAEQVGAQQSLPISAAVLDPLDDDIAEDLVNEIAKRS